MHPVYQRVENNIGTRNAFCRTESVLETRVIVSEIRKKSAQLSKFIPIFMRNITFNFLGLIF